MSVSQSRFGASARKTRWTWSSNTSGPAFLPFPRRRRCADERIPACEHSFHAVRRLIRHPARRASSAKYRYPNVGSSSCASCKACDRYAAARRRTSFSCSSRRDPLLQRTRLGCVRRGLARTVALLDISLTEPVLQSRFTDTEIGGDLCDGDAALTAASDRDNLLAELSRIRTGHDDILPASASQR